MLVVECNILLTDGILVQLVAELLLVESNILLSEGILVLDLVADLLLVESHILLSGSQLVFLDESIRVAELLVECNILYGLRR